MLNQHFNKFVAELSFYIMQPCVSCVVYDSCMLGCCMSFVLEKVYPADTEEDCMLLSLLKSFAEQQ